DLVAFAEQLAMAMADIKIGGAKLTIVVPANPEGRNANRKDFAFVPASIDHKSPLHRIPPGLIAVFQGLRYGSFRPPSLQGARLYIHKGIALLGGWEVRAR